MKFKVWFFSPDLEKAVKGWGETSVILFATDVDQVLHKFRDMFPDPSVLLIEELPEFVFHDNVELRGDQSKESNFTMDPENPNFVEFFAFDGVVHQAHTSVWHKVAQTMFVWNGKFDWVGG
jgi:hypothetical protein